MSTLYVHCSREAKIEVSENGVDWRIVSDEELAGALKRPKGKRDRTVIFSRENPLQRASGHARKVLSTIESARLPIKLVRRKGSDGSGESEPDGESSYASCMLVTLARSPGVRALLKPGRGVPNLEVLSSNQGDIPWLRGLPFNYPQLDADVVMKVLLSFPGNEAATLFGETREISVRMVLEEGKSEIVRFALTHPPSLSESGQLEVTRLIG